jgi:hypothetical protein
LFKPAFNKMAALGWLGRRFPVGQPRSATPLISVPASK